MGKLTGKILRSARRNPVFKLFKGLVPQSLKKGAYSFTGAFDVHTADGKSFKLYNQDFHLETSIFIHGMDGFDWERGTRKVWQHLCAQSSTIFDVGANTGIFAVLAKAYSPKAKVVAFEPQPNIYQILSNNNEVNNYDISCENLAASDEAGILPFYNYGADAFSGNSTAGSLNKEWRPREDQQAIEVTVVTLKDYCARHAIHSIDLLKVDVETLEYEVLKGMGGLLAHSSPTFVLEVMDKSYGEKIISLFKDLDYMYFQIDEKTGLKPVQVPGEKSGGTNHLCIARSKQALLEGLHIN